jgi:hypothetical protein
VSIETNHTLGRRFFEAQDRLRGGPDPALCAPGYIARLGSNPPMTLADHQGFASAFYAGFPDFRLKGTHTGAFMGIPATGKPIDIGAIAIFRVDNGRVAGADGQFDQLGMMRQLGVVP